LGWPIADLGNIPEIQPTIPILLLRKVVSDLIKKKNYSSHWGSQDLTFALTGRTTNWSRW
jgi:hypothetical protein